jgi:hypothetical protein
VGVQVHEAGRHDLPVRIDRPGRLARTRAAQLGDPAVFDPDVTMNAGRSRAIHDGAAFDVQVEFSHRSPPS